jgi:DNA-binding cell septation regulator SpoVG
VKIHLCLKSLFVVCLEKAFLSSEVFCPYRGASIFPKDSRKAHSLGVVCLRTVPVFLTKDRIFSWCAWKKYFNFLGLISGVKRKEAYVSQVKTKQKTNRKEVKSMIEVARVYKVEKDESSLKAFVDIKVADAVLIKGIRVMAKKDGGLFAAMPSHLAGDGKYYDTVQFLTPEAKNELQEVVLAAYQA